MSNPGRTGKCAADATLETMTAADVPPPVRRGRPGYDREQVLGIAVRLFNEQGYDATSVSALAARLGLTKSALYHHFESKASILGIALDDALGALEAALDAAVRENVRASDQLRQLVRGAVGVLTAKLPQVTLLLRVRGNGEVEQSALRRRRAFDQRVIAIVRAAQQEGMIRADVDAAVATRLVFGMVNSLVEWYRPGGPVDPDELAEDVLRATLDGLHARP